MEHRIGGLEARLDAVARALTDLREQMATRIELEAIRDTVSLEHRVSMLERRGS